MSAELPSESSIWGWLVTGLGGMVNLVERMAASGVRPTDDHLQTISTTVDRLVVAIDTAAGCTQHSGKKPLAAETDHAQQAPAEVPADPSGQSP